MCIKGTRGPTRQPSLAGSSRRGPGGAGKGLAWAAGTYPVLINNIYNRDQLPGMRPKGDVGHPANLYEAPEHLKLGGGGRENSQTN